MRHLLFTLLLATAVFAAPTLEKAARTIEGRTLRIELAWTRTPAGGSASNSSGTLRIAPGNRFAFRSRSVTLVSDGTTFWQYMPRAKQVLIQNLSAVNPASLPMGLLHGALKAKTLSSRVEMHDGSSAQRLELGSGQAPLSRYRSATLWLRQNSEPMELSVSDAQGNRTSWKLGRIQEFSPGPQTFTFRVPAGISVVDTRK